MVFQYVLNQSNIVVICSQTILFWLFVNQTKTNEKHITCGGKVILELLREHHGQTKKSFQRRKPAQGINTKLLMRCIRLICRSNFWSRIFAHVNVDLDYNWIMNEFDTRILRMNTQTPFWCPVLTFVNKSVSMERRWRWEQTCSSCFTVFSIVYRRSGWTGRPPDTQICLDGIQRAGFFCGSTVKVSFCLLQSGECHIVWKWPIVYLSTLICIRGCYVMPMACMCVCVAVCIVIGDAFGDGPMIWWNVGTMWSQ